jgi:hypothetical protein
VSAGTHVGSCGPIACPALSHIGVLSISGSLESDSVIPLCTLCLYDLMRILSRRSPRVSYYSLRLPAYFPRCHWSPRVVPRPTSFLLEFTTIPHVCLRASWFVIGHLMRYLIVFFAFTTLPLVCLRIPRVFIGKSRCLLHPRPFCIVHGVCCTSVSPLRLVLHLECCCRNFCCIWIHVVPCLCLSPQRLILRRSVAAAICFALECRILPHILCLSVATTHLFIPECHQLFPECIVTHRVMSHVLCGMSLVECRGATHIICSSAHDLCSLPSRKVPSSGLSCYTLAGVHRHISLQGFASYSSFFGLSTSLFLIFDASTSYTPQGLCFVSGVRCHEPCMNPPCIARSNSSSHDCNCRW